MTDKVFKNDIISTKRSQNAIKKSAKQQYITSMFTVTKYRSQNTKKVKEKIDNVKKQTRNHKKQRMSRLIPEKTIDIFNKEDLNSVTVREKTENIMTHAPNWWPFDRPSRCDPLYINIEDGIYKRLFAKVTEYHSSASSVVVISPQELRTMSKEPNTYLLCIYKDRVKAIYIDDLVYRKHYDVKDYKIRIKMDNCEDVIDDLYI